MFRAVVFVPARMCVHPGSASGNSRANRFTVGPFGNAHVWSPRKACATQHVAKRHKRLERDEDPARVAADKGAQDEDRAGDAADCAMVSEGHLDFEGTSPTRRFVPWADSTPRSAGTRAKVGGDAPPSFDEASSTDRPCMSAGQRAGACSRSQPVCSPPPPFLLFGALPRNRPLPRPALDSSEFRMRGWCLHVCVCVFGRWGAKHLSGGASWSACEAIASSSKL